jgi:hypothetical protein
VGLSLNERPLATRRRAHDAEPPNTAHRPGKRGEEEVERPATTRLRETNRERAKSGAASQIMPAHIAIA